MLSDPSGGPRALRVAMAPDAPVVVAGVQTMLRTAGPDIVSAGLWEQGQPISADVLLYDPHREIPALPREPSSPILVAFAWSVEDDVATRARAQGASGLVSKELSASRLLAAIRSIHGERAGFTIAGPGDGPRRPAGVVQDRDARPGGLTPREAEMLELITQGLSNDEIARSLYLSINSVKTYIRTAYRKIGVTRRPQAVLWGIQHGYGDDLRAGLRG